MSGFRPVAGIQRRHQLPGGRTPQPDAAYDRRAAGLRFDAFKIGSRERVVYSAILVSAASE